MRVWVWFIERLVRLIAVQLFLKIVMVFMILEVLFIWWLITWRRSFSLWALFTLSSFLLTSRTCLFFLFEFSRCLPSFPQEFVGRYATKSQKLLNPLLRCNKISYLTFNLCFNRFRLYFPRKFSTLSTLDWLSRLHPTPCRHICYRPLQFHIFFHLFLSWKSSSIWPKWFLPPTALTFWRRSQIRSCRILQLRSKTVGKCLVSVGIGSAGAIIRNYWHWFVWPAGSLQYLVCRWQLPFRSRL
jgi:hypothetical protein